ncbi:DUF72 domain-containing protein [Planctomicrobium piriforme]|uniref:Uncharacterized conserved protein YecE, DUF72 family n=1 Tax=Planctomicrobium piriforme TaxID=1576369 RepID=A0A1I3CKG7_9PLAN|nr:DUF72 domain-containing protein [Planctomicrobium piriforme]SFH74997.1 Uncharacterized conserved protein YecE, DUF72 family [Planctomicrobium piriforme]
MRAQRRVLIGCAGWNAPRGEAFPFPAAGTHLERYAAVFSAVEINSSFYRPHRPQTYRRWAAVVPDEFRFSVKIPKQITHGHRLASVRDLLSAFFEQSAELEQHLGCYLIQLPPSLSFDEEVAAEFLGDFRTLSSIPAVCEPRHVSWFSPAARQLLKSQKIGYVQADPSPVVLRTEREDFGRPVYLRLHGAPRVYYSAYSDTQLLKIDQQIRKWAESADDVWCIFDNTAAGAAIDNALQLRSYQNLTKPLR